MNMLDELINNFCHQYLIIPSQLLIPQHIYRVEELLEEVERRFGEEVTDFVATVLFEEACRKDPDFKDQTFSKLKHELTEEKYKKAENLYSKVKLEKSYFGRENLSSNLLRHAKVYS